MIILLWAHVPILGVWALLSPSAGVMTAALLFDVAAAGILAPLVKRRRLSSSMVSVGLMACAAAVVMLGGGLTDLHLYFMVLIAVVALYQDWTPFLAAIIFVLIHHLGMGVLDPSAVFSDRAAQRDPLPWAFLHAGFVLGECVALAIGWRITEHSAAGERKALTDQAKLTEELRRAQEMEALGRLAGGIAHEINTPMQFISDNLTYLSDAWEGLSGLFDTACSAPDRLRSNEPVPAVAADLEASIAQADVEFAKTEVPSALAQSQEGVERVAGIVKAMKEFGHPDHDEQELADINHLVTNTITVARNEIKYVANVETDLGDLPMVSCYPGALAQVVLNLLINSAQALREPFERSGERGRITVATWIDNGFSCISVADTGPGIPEQILPSIFLPFFTTKSVGQGTGQGLALAWKTIVDRHKGNLEVSTSEQGTTFVIRIPGRAAVDRDSIWSAEPAQAGALR